MLIINNNTISTVARDDERDIVMLYGEISGMYIVKGRRDANVIAWG